MKNEAFSFFVFPSSFFLLSPRHAVAPLKPYIHQRQQAQQHQNFQPFGKSPRETFCQFASRRHKCRRYYVQRRHAVWVNLCLTF